VERVLAEELPIIDADSPLWIAVRSLLDVALQLDQHDNSYCWHGWTKEQITTFLQGLPPHCTLLVGVWETIGDEYDSQEKETLRVGCVCEVVQGVISSLRTFEALPVTGLLPVNQLEPGIEHALEIMRITRMQVAPVAWALFTDKTTWDEWIFAESGDSTRLDKGKALTLLARQGRCVLKGNQTKHHHL